MIDMKACCYQFPTLPGNIEANLSRVEARIESVADTGCKLLLLPEMWTCAFPYPVLREMARETPRILERQREWAIRYGMVIVGSLPEFDGGKVFNTSFVLDSDGSLAGAYRKIHLFSLNREDVHFGRGEKAVVCETSVGKLGIQVCYDLRFPETSRKLALEGAEILCFSAQWPTVRIDHWSTLLRARAIENQLFVMGCNGCGTEGRLVYGGGSAVISPLGQVLAEAGRDEMILGAEVGTEELMAFRKLIPCFEDRRPGAYGERCEG